MRLLYCVQRYGEDIAGGAEAACRSLAERMAARGHSVHVATSCAKSYTDWADYFPRGVSELNGVTVHRFPVREPRTPERFGSIHRRLMTNPRAPLYMQRDWMRLQGPDVPELTAWIGEEAHGFDAAVFYTYLYPTTAFGLPEAARGCPTVLIPAAHDEPMLQFRIFDGVVRRADGIVCQTPEEHRLICRRFRFQPRVVVHGIGLETEFETDPRRFREAFGLGERPYLIVLGRVDSNKGSDELHRYFIEYKNRHPSDLTLVVVGEAVTELSAHVDIVHTGFVDEQTKLDALAGSVLLVQPSFFESYSLALCEAWLCERPALVQGRCEVLAGQSRRSKGGIPYTSFAEFAEALHRLIADPALRTAMGESGRRYVLENYTWDAVLDRHESFIAAVSADTSPCSASSEM